jgi:hypothetical protein
MRVNTAQKLEVLRDVAGSTDQFDRVLDKLLAAALSQHRLQLTRYDHDLYEFEQKFGIDSDTFYQQFEAGKLGDAMDFFEWAGLYELREKVMQKIRRLELAL